MKSITGKLCLVGIILIMGLTMFVKDVTISMEGVQLDFLDGTGYWLEF